MRYVGYDKEVITMSVFRTKKIKNFTVMSNNHLKQPDLSFKARGILSTMLAFPDDWEYTIEGLAKMASDGVKSTRSGVNELVEKGFLVRRQERDEKGLFTKIIYDVYEIPFSFLNNEKADETLPTDTNNVTANNNQNEVSDISIEKLKPKENNINSTLRSVHITSERNNHPKSTNDLITDYNTDKPKSHNGITADKTYFQNGYTDNTPIFQNGLTDKISDFAAKLSELCEEFYKFCGVPFSPPQVPFRQADKCRQLNTIIPNTDNNINLSIDQSLDRARIDRTMAVKQKTADVRECPSAKDYERYKNIIKENVEYDSIVNSDAASKDYLDEIIDIMADVVTFNKNPIRINGYEVSADVIRSRFLKIDEFEMDYILQSIDKYTDKIYNIRSYLITTIYNAKSTINHYFASMVRYDMSHPKERVCCV